MVKCHMWASKGKYDNWLNEPRYTTAIMVNDLINKGGYTEDGFRVYDYYYWTLMLVETIRPLSKTVICNITILFHTYSV